MKRISIERYKNPDEMQSAGLIEGETDDGRRWILFLDQSGAPDIFWPERDQDTGAVRGHGIKLDARTRKFTEIMSDPDPQAALTRLKGAVRAAERMMNDPEEFERVQTALASRTATS